MRIRGNWISLVSWRTFSGATSQVDRAIRRLSSGLRVNSAGDDAAGLSISQRLQGQFRGLIRANKNALDGISLLQTAESALNEVHALLHRSRELSVKAANGTLGTSDRMIVQAELNQLMSEIDRIVTSTTFNGMRILSPSGAAGASARVLAGLRSGWLEQAERVIENALGITGDGTKLSIKLENSGSQSAWVAGVPNAVTGQLDSLTLHINLADFQDDSGIVGPMFDDRKIARALTQAVLARNSDFEKIDQWFVSGLSDYVIGGDEQLKASLAAVGGNAQAIVNAIDDAINGTWQDTAAHRSAAYLAVKYLDRWAEPGRNMPAMLQYLQTNTFEDTIKWAYGSPSLNSFLLDFKDAAIGGASFLVDELDLDDDLVGAIGGGDAVTVIPDGGTYSNSPLTYFAVEWPQQSAGMAFTLQVGANEGQTIRFTIAEVSTSALDLLGLDVVNKATDAMNRLLVAIDTVSSIRTYLGSVHNRVEYTYNANGTNSENTQAGHSRIVDLDMAREVTNLTKHQILVSSSGAMLAQANATRQHVMWLLNGLPSAL